jgi:hypothetical protein
MLQASRRYGRWHLLVPHPVHCKMHQGVGLNGPTVTSNPIVYVVYISTISQLDDDIKTLLYYVNYSGNVSPVLFKLATTAQHKSRRGDNCLYGTTVQRVSIKLSPLRHIKRTNILLTAQINILWYDIARQRPVNTLTMPGPLLGNGYARKNRRTVENGVFCAVRAERRTEMQRVVGECLKASRAAREQNMVMSPVGIGTKNHCAGEDQQQFSSQSESSGRMWVSEWSVVLRPLLSSKRRPHFKTRKSLKRTKIWSWVPKGPNTKNNCAGEGRQQNLLDWRRIHSWSNELFVR